MFSNPMTCLSAVQQQQKQQQINFLKKQNEELRCTDSSQKFAEAEKGCK